MTAADDPTFSLELRVTLRNARRDDLPRLEWYGQYKHFRNLFRRAYREQQTGRRLILLADLNGFPVGYVFIHFKKEAASRRAYLYSFRVMEMFRGQGIGTRLIQEAEAIIIARNIERVVIAVAKTNLDAKRLYERLAYRVFAEDDGRWRYTDHRGITHYVHEPCWLLEKFLSPR